jgi:hypothetical protein
MRRLITHAPGHFPLRPRSLPLENLPDQSEIKVAEELWRADLDCPYSLSLGSGQGIGPRFQQPAYRIFDPFFTTKFICRGVDWLPYPVFSKRCMDGQ